jgi:hypothetical protein
MHLKIRIFLWQYRYETKGLFPLLGGWGWLSVQLRRITAHKIPRQLFVRRKLLGVGHAGRD